MATNENAVNAQTAKKRRGINNETRSVAQLKFHESDAAPNHLFIGHIETVSVEWSTKADNNSFPNMPVPRLNIHFQSDHKDNPRHAYLTFFPVESSIDTIPGGKDEWKFNNLMGYIKHILEVLYLKGRQFTPAEEDALCIGFDDTDNEGNYSPVEPEDVLNAYRVLFDNVSSMLNGTFGLAEGETAKPCIKNSNGTPVRLWMKLIRHKKNKGEWINVTNGDLAFDSFVGNGVIELFKENTMPVLRLDLVKESITPQQVKVKAKTPDVGGIGATGNFAPGAGFGNNNPGFGGAGIDPLGGGAFMPGSAGVEAPY